jgi:hypothetical protein
MLRSRGDIGELQPSVDSTDDAAISISFEFPGSRVSIRLFPKLVLPSVVCLARRDSRFFRMLLLGKPRRYQT